MNVFNNVILERNRQLPDDDRMVETCRIIFKSFNVNSLSVCIGWCADQVTSAHITKTPTRYKTSYNNHSARYTPNDIVTIHSSILSIGDRGGTVVKVLCYKSEGRWFDTSWCQWIFH